MRLGSVGFRVAAGGRCWRLSARGRELRAVGWEYRNELGGVKARPMWPESTGAIARPGLRALPRCVRRSGGPPVGGLKISEASGAEVIKTSFPLSSFI